jgi:hypothetical protein
MVGQHHGVWHACMACMSHCHLLLTPAALVPAAPAAMHCIVCSTWAMNGCGHVLGNCSTLGSSRGCACYNTLRIRTPGVSVTYSMFAAAACMSAPMPVLQLCPCSTILPPTDRCEVLPTLCYSMPLKLAGSCCSCALMLSRNSCISNSSSKNNVSADQ